MCDSIKLPHKNTVVSLLNQFTGPHSLRRSQTAAGTAERRALRQKCKIHDN